MNKAELETLNVHEIEAKLIEQGIELPYKGGTRKQDYINQAIVAFNNVVLDLDPVDVNTGEDESLTPPLPKEEEELNKEEEEEFMKEQEDKTEEIEVLLSKVVRASGSLRNSPSLAAKKTLVKNINSYRDQLKELGYTKEV